MTPKYKTPKEIDSYVNAKSSFTDYVKFEDSAVRRKAAQHAFIDDETYEPMYEYPKLMRLYDEGESTAGTTFAEKKHATYEAILELEANKESGVLDPEEYEFYAAYHEDRLKKMMLVETARRLMMAGSSQESVTARSEFMTLNREIYGDIDIEMFGAMMATESRRVDRFVPADGRSRDIHQALLTYFDRNRLEGQEPELMSEKKLHMIREILHKRYPDSYACFPDSPDDVYYDAEECAQMLTDAMRASGVLSDDWVCEVHQTKTAPSTATTKHKVLLPATTRRNASELRRLFLHEVIIHAQTGQRGEETGIKALKLGTAKYADVQEGEGVLMECAEAGNFDNPSIDRARDRYIVAGLALGADGTPRDGRSTYELMWRLLAVRYAGDDGHITREIEAKAKQMATVHDDNAYRGTNFAMPGIIYSKLKMYWEGLVKAVQYFDVPEDEIEQRFDDSLIAKYNFTDPEEKRQVEVLIAKKKAARASAQSPEETGEQNIDKT